MPSGDPESEDPQSSDTNTRPIRLRSSNHQPIGQPVWYRPNFDNIFYNNLLHCPTSMRFLNLGNGPRFKHTEEV